MSLTLNRFIKPITLLVGGAVYVFLFYHVLEQQPAELLATLEIPLSHPSLIVQLASLWLIYIVCQGLYLRHSFMTFEIHIPLGEATRIWLATVATGVITFGIAGPILLFFESRQRAPHLSSSQQRHVVIRYYIGYILSTSLFALSSLGLVTTYLPLRLIIFCIALIMVLIPTVKGWRWLNPLPALPSIIANFALFVAVLAGFGVTASLTQTLASFNVNTILSLISPSSGGVGFVEFGLFKSLESSGLTTTQIPLVILGYRLINFWLTVAVGATLLGLAHLKPPQPRN